MKICDADFGKRLKLSADERGLARIDTGIEKDNQNQNNLSPSESICGSITTKPGQYREFEDTNGNTHYVMYWHLVGGEPYDYGERFNTKPHPLKWLRDSVKFAFRGSKEQWFIRIASPFPFEVLMEDPAFQEVLLKLEPLMDAD